MPKYIPPSCGLSLVTETVPGRTFFGWRCAKCDGPVYIAHGLALAMTGHSDAATAADEVGFYHDLKSDFYWTEPHLTPTQEAPMSATSQQDQTPAQRIAEQIDIKGLAERTSCNVADLPQS